MKREVHSAKDNLDWKLRLVWAPNAIRPIGPRDIYAGKVGGGVGATGALGVPFSLLMFLILVIPVMAIVLPLRYARAVAWHIEAIAYPWGKRGGPAQILRWRVKGRRAELQRVMDDIAAALESGNRNRQISGATRDRD